MGREDFLKKIDGKLAAAEKTKAEKESQRKVLEAKVVAIVKEVVPVLDGYKTELEKRNIAVEFLSGPTSFSFLMHYADGGHHGIELRPDYEHGTYNLDSLFTDYDSRNYRSSGPSVGDGWSIDVLESIVQRTIDEFLSYAPRHNGPRKVR